MSVASLLYSAAGSGAFNEATPDRLEADTPSIGTVCLVRFNRKGSLLAAGCIDGGVVIWDMGEFVARPLRLQVNVFFLAHTT